MKMVKSLLLGSAAGLVAVSAGQAADLPVKAKPVEYVKVCSLYGAGFYYMPGTDVCMKIGGFLRTEINVHAAGSFTPFANGANAFQFRSEDNFITRARAALTADVREQTSYGTLRAYLAAGWQYSSNDPAAVSLPAAAVAATGGGASPANANNTNLYLLRAFIQLGGFTFGKTASFYDFFNTSKYTLQTNFINQDFAGFGVFTYGYTQQFGNGFAATIAAQDPSVTEHSIVDVGGAAAVGSLFALPPTNNNFQNAGTLVPDIVGSLRVDQAWGGAQVAGIAHQVRARYWNTASIDVGTTTETGVPALAGVGHPDDKWGWAGMAGLELNLQGFLPFFTKGDSFAVQGQYCVGEVFACYNNSGNHFQDLSWSLINVNKIGLGWLDDGFMANTTEVGATGIQLATNWNVFAAIQHYWVPELRTSLYGGYTEYKANSNAVDVEVCQELNEGELPGFTNPLTHHGVGRVSPTGCLDWAAFEVGSRTLWNPTRNLDVGVDVLYTSMTKTAFSGAIANFPGPGGTGATTTLNVADTHIWAGILRIQYNFLP
jgi:Porin subfamily